LNVPIVQKSWAWDQLLIDLKAYRAQISLVGSRGKTRPHLNPSPMKHGKYEQIDNYKDTSVFL
jgi:hypothetical protein